MKKIFFRFNLFILVIFGLFLISQDSLAAGATLYLSPSTGTKVVNTNFYVSVRLSTGGQDVNASDGTVTFDTDKFSVVGISKSGSIFDLWTVNPSHSGDTISFSGGMFPPGFNGNGGKILTITFRAKKVGTGQVRLTSGSALANDGKGTNILASMGSASFTISPRISAPDVKDPIKDDNQPPPIQREPDRIKPVITSVTHPDSDTWYKNNTPKFSWELFTGVTGVSLLLDQKQYSNPGPVSDGLLTEKEYEFIAPGEWYFHLKFKDTKGWGTITHYKILIDNVPPKQFIASTTQTNKYDWPTLLFKTEDEHSGIVKYLINIGSLEELAHEVGADINLLKASDLSIGKHIALVKAIDKAGNEEHSTVEFYIEPIEAPTIENYSEEIKPSDKFFISGRAIPNSKIELYIQDDDHVFTKETNSDKDGNWFAIFEDNLAKGRYVAWAKTVNENGLRSDESKKVSFLVTPPIFARIGDFVINYFTVFVSLIFMIVLIAAIIFYLFAFVRKKLEKETDEIEDVVRKNMDELRKTTHEDVVKEKINEVEKKIIKEIKDVEDILK